MRQQLVIPKAWRFTRASAVDPNPANIISRAGTFAATAPDGTVLVTKREADGLTHYMYAPEDTRVGDAAINLAQTVGAHVDVLDMPPDVFESRHMVVARQKRGSGVGRETQAGFELGEVSLRLATILKDGEWVAAVIRRPAEREKRWHQTWMTHHTGGRQQHHSTTANAVIMSLWAGSASVGEGKNILRQVAAALPGFDLTIEPVPVTTYGKGLAAIAAGIAAGVLSTLALTSGIFTGLIAAQLLFGFLLGAAAPAIIGGILYILGRVPSYAEKVKRFARFNRLLFARSRRFWFAKPRRERTDRDGAVIAATDGKYPLDAQAFLAGPHLAAALIAPQAGADSGTSSTRSRVASARMYERIGPIIGDNDNRAVSLSAADGWSGIAMFGAAGSGKSQLTQSLWGWASLERVSPTGNPRWPGRANALIAFESKGDGADKYEQWIRATGDRAIRIDFSGTSDIQLDILAVPGNAERKARSIANAMKYAFSDGSIQERSFETLVQVFTGAFAVTADIATQAGLPPTMSPIGYANALIGKFGDDAGKALYGAIKSEAVRVHAAEDTDLAIAAAKLADLYEQRTPSARQNLQQAPSSKISALFAAEDWWQRPKKLTWDQVLHNHLAIIVNTGSNGHDNGGRDDELTNAMSAMMMYTLYEAIKRCCFGWWDQNRWVSIYADELKLLAGSSETVLTWLRDQGRGYGVRATFATQYPEQLSLPVRNAVMGFGTVLAFVQANPVVIDGLVADFAVAGDEWVPADIANLNKYQAIVRTQVDQQRQPPFTVNIRNFTGNMAEFAADQGYARKVNHD